VKGLFETARFEGFGPHWVALDEETPACQRIDGPDASTLRAGVRAACPNGSGVYGMLDPRDELLYVGKSKRLRTRLLSYFRAKDPRDKARRILDCTRTLVWEPCPNEFAALLRELELIRRWRPKMNVKGQPGRDRRGFVCLGREPVPHAYFARELSAQTRAGFGPIASGEPAKEAVRRLNDWFQLRDCPDRQPLAYANQAVLFPVLASPGCLRYEIGTCLGPCIAAVTAQKYRQRITQARAFLEGRDDTAVNDLHADMAHAAEARDYERAARLRDSWQALTWLRAQLDRLHEARRRLTFVYPLEAEDQVARWYLVRGGQVAGVVRAPTDAASARLVCQHLDRLYPARGSGGVEVGREDLDILWLLLTWFQKFPEELSRTLNPDEARAVCAACTQPSRRTVSRTKSRARRTAR